MDPGWVGDVELHEGGYWSGSLCAGVGGSGGAGGAAGVRVADSVVSGSGAGGVGGDSKGGRGVGGIWLCFMSVVWVEWWGFCGGGGGVGGLGIGVVVWLEDGFVVLEWEGDFLRRFSLKSVAGNTFVGACLFGMVICGGGFFDFLDFLCFLELLEVGMLV